MANGRNHRTGCVCRFCLGGALREAPGLDLAQMGAGQGIVQLDRQMMAYLLGLIGERLLERGVAASIYVVGGGALALSYGRTQLTPDIDVAASIAAVFEESQAVADEQGLPLLWLNDRVRPYLPARPEWATEEPTEPGLTVYVAPPEHLLVMKLVADRIKDHRDIVLLIDECGVADYSAEQLADLMHEVYAGEDELAHLLNIPQSDPDQTRAEAVARCQDALTRATRFRADGRL